MLAPVKRVLFTLAALLLFIGRIGRADAADKVLIEIVKVEVHEHDVELHVTTSLKEPVVATDSKPTMPPMFSRMELDGVLGKWGAYFMDHAHLIVRTKPLLGKVTATKIVEAFDAPIQENELERVHGELTIVYTMPADDPITASFDVLDEKGLSVAYVLDVHGPRSKKADLAPHEQYTFDVAEPQGGGGANTGPRLGTSTQRRRAIPTGTAIGAIIFIGIIYVAYSVIKKRMKK
jgi:hypothetical protein